MRQMRRWTLAALAAMFMACEGAGTGPTAPAANLTTSAASPAGPITVVSRRFDVAGNVIATDAQVVPRPARSSPETATVTAARSDLTALLTRMPAAQLSDYLDPHVGAKLTVNTSAGPMTARVVRWSSKGAPEVVSVLWGGAEFTVTFALLDGGQSGVVTIDRRQAGRLVSEIEVRGDLSFAGAVTQAQSAGGASFMQAQMSCLSATITCVAAAASVGLACAAASIPEPLEPVLAAGCVTAIVAYSGAYADMVDQCRLL